MKAVQNTVIQNEPPTLKEVIHVLCKKCSLNPFCADEQKTTLVKNMTSLHYKKGEIIFHEGQPSFLIYFVYSGVIKLWKEGLHKAGQTLRFAKEGDKVGFWGAFENQSYTLSASALTDCHLYCIAKDVFFPIVKNNSALHVYLHDYIADLKKTEDHLRNMAEMNVKEKVANSILILLDVFKGKMNEETSKIVLSRKEIAALCATCEDRVSKQLSEFRTEKIIVIKENATSIDVKALQEIITPFPVA